MADMPFRAITGFGVAVILFVSPLWGNHFIMALPAAGISLFIATLLWAAIHSDRQRRQDTKNQDDNVPLSVLGVFVAGVWFILLSLTAISFSGTDSYMPVVLLGYSLICALVTVRYVHFLHKLTRA